MFTLPIIVQWLGARAIRSELISISELVNEESRMLKWRYSLSILFNQMTYEESEVYFTYIVENVPEVAAIIVRDGISLNMSDEIEDAKTIGKKMYKCMQSWLANSGEFANKIGLKSEGILNTLGICNCAQNAFMFSWANTYLGVDVTTAEKNIVYPNFTKKCRRGVFAQATWPWIVTFEYLSSILKDNLEIRHWLVLDGAMEKEFVWANTLKLLGKGNSHQESIDLKEVERYRANSDFYRNVDLKMYFHLIDRLKNRGHNKIEVPFVSEDMELKSGYVWNGYSRERMRLRVEQIYTDVFEEYKKLVDGFFAGLKDHFSTYVNMPCKMVGSLCYGGSGDNDGPSVQYYLETLPSSAKSNVEITLEQERSSFNKDSKAIFEKMQKKARTHRGDKCEHIRLTIRGQRHEMGTPCPVTDIVYGLLIEDLKKTGWITG